MASIKFKLKVLPHSLMDWAHLDEPKFRAVCIPYPIVNKNVKYRFVLARKDKNLLTQGIRWLKVALDSIGLGAKGGQRYGVFKIKKKESTKHDRCTD